MYLCTEVTPEHIEDAQWAPSYVLINEKAEVMNIYTERWLYNQAFQIYPREKVLMPEAVHEYLGYDLDGISLDAKTCPGLIFESSGFTPCEDFPSFWVFHSMKTGS